MRAFETEKTEVAEIDRSVYDIKDKVNAAFEVNSGLTAEIVEQISKEKHDPDWMREFRLKALDIYNKASIPNWGPSLEGLDMRNIVTYVRPNTEMRGKWSEVPDDIKNTFERLGIPQAERSSLAGVGAQYDSEVVYHNVKEEVAAQGGVYTDMESSLLSEAKSTRLLPFHRTQFAPPAKEKAVQEPFEFYPSVGAVLNSMIPSYVSGFLYSALLDSFCSEQNARMTAMDAANQNAEELLSALRLQYNRVRQAAITQEITEISAGAAAQRGTFGSEG